MQEKLRKTMGEIWRSIKENKKKVIHIIEGLI